MGRLMRAWTIAILLTALGTQLAHDVGYRLAGSPPLEHPAGASSHATLAVLPVAAAMALALLAAGLTLAVLDGTRGRARARIERWPFLAVPPLAFLAQELAEHALAGHGLDLSIVLDRPVLLGLALQLPFALATYAAARLLLRVSSALRRVLGRRTRRQWSRSPLVVAVPASRKDAAPRHGLLTTWAVRGPPASAR